MKVYVLLFLIIILILIIFNNFEGFNVGGEKDNSGIPVNKGEKLNRIEDCANCSSKTGNAAECDAAPLCKYCPSSNDCITKSTNCDPVIINDRYNCSEDGTKCEKAEDGKTGIFLNKWDCERQMDNWRRLNPDDRKCMPKVKPFKYECVNNFNCTATTKQTGDNIYDTIQECTNNCYLPGSDCTNLKETCIKNDGYCTGKTICDGTQLGSDYNCDGEMITDPSGKETKDKCKSNNNITLYKCNNGTCEGLTFPIAPSKEDIKKYYATLEECQKGCKECSTYTDSTTCNSIPYEKGACTYCDITKKCMGYSEAVQDCNVNYPEGTNIPKNQDSSLKEPTPCRSNSDCASKACDLETNFCLDTCDKGETCSYFSSGDKMPNKWVVPEQSNISTANCVNTSDNQGICPLGQIKCTEDNKCESRLCDPRNQDCTEVNKSDPKSFKCSTDNLCPWIGFNDNKCNILSQPTSKETEWCCAGGNAGGLPKKPKKTCEDGENSCYYKCSESDEWIRSGKSVKSTCNPSDLKVSIWPTCKDNTGPIYSQWCGSDATITKCQPTQNNLTDGFDGCDDEPYKYANGNQACNKTYAQLDKSDRTNAWARCKWHPQNSDKPKDGKGKCMSDIECSDGDPK